jgi:chloramphenicol-sensitive protein RarD
LLLAGNWGLFIWAVNNHHMLDASLGYYINPLLNILLGMLFLGERLRPAQWAAVALAFSGVLLQLIHFGSLPWIALVLAGSFALYGLFRKKLATDAIGGLFIESLLLMPLALLYWSQFADSPYADLTQNPLSLNLWLVAAGVVTTVPLLCFIGAAKRLQLSTLGFFQYIGPSFMFIFGVFLYNEPLDPSKLLTFGFIWTALCLYSFDAWRHLRRPRQAPSTAH